MPKEDKIEEKKWRTQHRTLPLTYKKLISSFNQVGSHNNSRHFGMGKKGANPNKSRGCGFFGKDAREKRNSKVRTDEDIARDNADTTVPPGCVVSSSWVGGAGVEGEIEDDRDPGDDGEDEDGDGDDFSEGGELERRAEFTRKLWMWEFGQNDPKR